MPIHRRLRLALPIVALLAVPSATLAGSGRTVWVDDDGHAGAAGCGAGAIAADTIQEGVDDAAAGDTVRVCPGLYVETVRIGAHQDGLTLTATSLYGARIRPPEGLEEEATLVRVRRAEGVSIRWFDVVAPTTGDCQSLGAAVELDRAVDASVRGMRFRIVGGGARFECGYLTAIAFGPGSSGVAAFNRVIDFGADAIDVAPGAQDVLIQRNSIRASQLHTDHLVGGGSGIEASTPSVRILDNVVSGHATDIDGHLQTGISLDIEADDHWQGQPRPLVRGNTIHNALYGIWAFSEAPYPSGRSMRLLDNTITGIDGARGIYVEEALRPTLRRNRVTDFDTNIWLSAETRGGIIDGNQASVHEFWDCIDESTGSRTAGTANTWTDNISTADSPDGICPPAP